MGIFSDALKSALFTGDYICPDCGARMEFEDEEFRDILVCNSCGNSMDLLDYGSTEDERYERLHPENPHDEDT